MAIVVVCQSCHKRFKVSEKFAGKKGPCPNCKETIYVPKADEQVQIHTPEHSEASARGRGGDLVLKPIEREETKLPTWAVISIGVACLMAMIIALILRGAEDSTKRVMAMIGAIVLAPTLVLAGYTFLRDDELEPYRGMWLWIRTGICSAVYVLCWAVYGFLVPEEWTDELWKWAFLGPAFGAAGATAAFACFDLDFGSGFFHFVFYAGVTLLLALMMGLPVFGG
jgi:hypothetical protein